MNTEPTDTHHNDQQRSGCPVCLVTALTAERDRLRARAERAEVELDFQVARNSDLFAQRDEAFESQEKAETELAAERDQLRAEVKRLSALGSWAHTCIHHTDEERKAWAACPCCAIARAERAEAEAERYRLVTLRQDADLAAERARLDWLAESWDNPLAIHLHPSYGWSAASKNLRATIDAAMKEGAK